jgi:hypothetical protein
MIKKSSRIHQEAWRNGIPRAVVKQRIKTSEANSALIIKQFFTTVCSEKNYKIFVVASEVHGWSETSFVNAGKLCMTTITNNQIKTYIAARSQQTWLCFLSLR